MENTNELKKKLRTIKLVDKKVSYELSYDKTKDLKNFKRIEMLDYINGYYINGDDLEIEKLINDLITFKTYKDELNLIIENQNAFFGVLALLLAILSISTSFKQDHLSNIIALAILVILGLLVILIFVTYINFRENKNSNFNKLKVVNNAIHVLEDIRDYDYNNSNNSNKSL